MSEFGLVLRRVPFTGRRPCFFDEDLGGMVGLRAEEIRSPAAAAAGLSGEFARLRTVHQRSAVWQCRTETLQASRTEYGYLDLKLRLFNQERRRVSLKSG